MLIVTFIEAKPAELEYGGPEPISLTLTMLDRDGNRLPIRLEELALLQLAKLMRDIEGHLPGAVQGH
jgi:hypothetical protein